MTVREPRKDHIAPADGSSDEVLRAKYLDFCSAKLAETLLRLSPDEIYVLARAAADESGAGNELSYDRAVRLATESVSRSLDLPTFETWVEDYRTNPERYDAYLLGLWKTGLVPETDP